MYLASASGNRDNNFNLIRILAAIAVLISHCFVLSTGDPEAEPLRSELGMTLGSIAVDIFFVTSGFLVTASILRSRSIVDFTCARVLRIFPGLFAMLLLTVFLMGTALTTLPWLEYISSPGVYAYALKCGSLVTGVSYLLPGVFSENPYRGAVNGSLWTMPYEIRMYAIVALGWILTSTIHSLSQSW
jgi:peptidoglycan/LPS O-acetylase OafA/YrhL